jgi:hypothetical protein
MKIDMIQLILRLQKQPDYNSWKYGELMSSMWKEKWKTAG